MSDNHKIAPAPEVAIQQEKMHPLVTAAMRGGELDTQTLRELMELQREWERGEAKKAFTRDMVALKEKLPSIIDRDASVSFGQGKTSYTFTTMAHAMEMIQPHLVEFGFALNWVPRTEDGMIRVTCNLTHIDGHSEETTMSAPPDTSGSKNPVQAIGSTQSYLERYTALAVLGIVTRDMKDADHQKAPKDTVSIENNLKAVAYMQSIGITVSEAEKHIQNDVKSWTAADLANLREWCKERKALSQKKTADVTMDGLRKAVIAEAGKLWGEDEAMPRLAEMCRQHPDGGFFFTACTEEQGKWAFQEISDRIAALEAEKGA